MTKEIKKQQQLQNSSTECKPNVIVHQIPITTTTSVEETTIHKEENNGEIQIKCMQIGVIVIYFFNFSPYF